MINYNEMTDLEINREVAKNRYGCQGDVGDWLINGVKAISGDGFTYYEADFCNNPSDTWPIIVENKISIGSRFLNSWAAADPSCMYFNVDKNPLRAAMIVFLIMNEVEL